jgi:hypothetical protein
MDRNVKLWDAASGTEIISFDTHPNQVIAVAWSPDGMQLATASFDRTLHVLDAAPASEAHGVAGFLDALDRRLVSQPDSARDHALRSRTLTRLKRPDDARRENELAVEIYERLLPGHSDGDRYALEYSKFLLDRALAELEWTPLAPDALQATGEVTLTGRPDKSILAAGPTANGAVYEVAVTAPQRLVTGLRVEALPDASLPNRGPGRDAYGNFVLTQVTVLTAAAGDGEPPAEIPQRAARADFTQNDFRVERLAETPWAHEWGWAVYPAVGRAHEAIFEFEKPLDLGTKGKLTVRLGHKHPWALQSALGCFRLSLTTAPHPARLMRLRDDLVRSAARGWPRLAAAAALTGDVSTARLALDRGASIKGTETGEELFLLALAAAWLEQPAFAESYLARGLEWHAKNPIDASLNEVARDALAAIRHLGDTPASHLLKQLPE